MRTVVLDGYTANPGDLYWDKLKEFGECVIYDRTAPAEVLERAAGAEAPVSYTHLTLPTIA